MAAAGGASTWAAPRELLQVARRIALRMAEASGASTRAAPSLLSATRSTVYRAWRRQAVPARGLPQVSSNRRHATLPSAWWRQALPEGGLLQGSRSSSRQCVLHAMSPARAARRCVGRCTATAWRGPGAPSHGWDPGARTPPAAGGACGATHRLATAAVYMHDTILHIFRTHTTESPSRVRRRAQPAHPPQHPAAEQCSAPLN
jgi:hypothetical protein